jgi:hypothetical protein
MKKRILYVCIANKVQQKTYCSNSCELLVEDVRLCVAEGECPFRKKMELVGVTDAKRYVLRFR